MSGRSCPVCGAPLVIPPTGRRPVYCGTPCRQKAARARDAAARAAHDAAWARGQLTTEISRASSLATRLDSLYRLLPRPPRADDDAALAAGPEWEDDIAEAARSLARAAHRAADMAAAHARAAGACRAARAVGFRSATGEASSNDGTADSDLARIKALAPAWDALAAALPGAETP